MALIVPEIKAGGKVRILQNPNEWRGIEVGGVYQVLKTYGRLFSISTVDYPSGAYFFKVWGGAVWD